MTPLSSVKHRLLPLALWAVCMFANADTPAFDRPGIAFSTTTMPVGSFSIEQGLPDVQRDSAGGTKATLYSADTLIRIGLGKTVELQLGTALFNRLTLKDTTGSSSTNGFGDSAIGLKVALPSQSESLSWAVLGSVGLQTGEAAFTAGATPYSLGVTGSWDLSDAQAFALYANVDRLDGDNTFTVSPSFGFAINDTVSAYVEAGLSTAKGSDDYIAGGGVTWMVTPRIQLDAFADGGLTSASTDLQAGIGVSVYFE